MTKINFSVLPKNQSAVSIDGTISINADRKRYISGIFLPKIPQNYGLTTPEVYSELAVRATRRTKAGNRANNADCLMAVVEPLPHPTQAVSFTNKLTRTIKMLYKFILLGKNRLKLSIRANSEQQARKLLTLNSNALLIARINDHARTGGFYA